MRILLSSLLFLSFTVNAAVTEISIMPKGVDTFEMPIHFSSPFNSSSTTLLALGESLSNASIHIAAQESQQLKVSIQLETSMSIQDEGPHLDLVDWQHCTTRWFVVEKIDENKFTLPNFDNINVDCFPNVDISAIKKQAFKQGGQHWLSVIEKSLSNGYTPIAIDLSLVRIKVEEFVNSKWVLVSLLKIEIPLGC